MNLIIMHVLLIFAVIAAVVAIEVKDILSAVIAVGAVGFSVSLMFLFLGAPDIAITQVVVEIVSLILLIGATIKVSEMAVMKRVNNFVDIEINNFANIIGLVFIGLFLYFAREAITHMQNFGDPLMRVSSHYLKNFVQETGAVNAVASVILDYRAFDTLGEAMVLFTSIVGALAVLRRVGKKEEKPGKH